jgi:ribosomal protein L7/L12
MKKRILKESPIKSRARKLIMEGEVQSAESILASKDLVDRIQDMIKELGKMSTDELPHLVDSIRNTFGPDASAAYQTAVDAALTELLNQTKAQKTAVENATLTLTGDAPTNVGGSDLSLPEDSEDSDKDEIPSLDSINLGDDIGKKRKNPIGRELRMPTDEAFIKAKIKALNEALKATNTRKNPIRAKRLSEELRKVVTEAIKKEAAKKAKKAKSAKKELPAFLKKKVIAKKPTVK